jgi:hypothetical protein
MQVCTDSTAQPQDVSSAVSSPLGTLVLLAALFGAGAGPAAHAAPTRQTALQTAAQPTFGVPHEISKTILGETSIDGPAFWTNNGEPTAPPLYLLAWTGTGSLHHVNVQYTTSSPSWPSAGTKATLHETALGGPMMGCEVSSPGGPCQFVVAWTGTDAAHHINMAVIGV